MNEKDNETSQASGEETEKFGSGPIPEKDADLPEDETVKTPNEKTEEEIEVSPKTPEEEETIPTSEEESVEAFNEEPEEEVKVSPETPEEEETVVAFDEELVEASDEEPEEEIEVLPETPEEEETVVASDEELVEASDEESEEEVEVVPEIPSKEEIPVKEEIPIRKEPETPPESVHVIKEKLKEAPPKEVVIIKEVEKKPNKFVKKIRLTGLAIVLIILLALAGTIFAWTSGMDDLRDDNTYLIVVVYKDVPQAASMYHTDTKQSDVVEVTELGALSKNKQFFENAKKQHNVLIDRLIIIDMDTLKKLSTDEYIIYEKTDERIYVDEMCSWINGTIYPRPEIQKDDTPSIVKAKILKSWIDHYNDKLISGYDGYSARVILNAYRSGKIIIYPGNYALTVMKYIAVERIFFPID